MVLEVVKPFYGSMEDCMQWYLTYLRHHMVMQGMKNTTLTALYCLCENGKLTAVIALQVDYFLEFGDEAFLKEKKSK